MKVLPKENVTFPFHRCVRGSVLWVHPNKEAVKSFQAPGYVCLFICFWPPWPFWTIQIVDLININVRQVGMFRLSTWENQFVIRVCSRVYCWVCKYPRTWCKTEVIYFVHKCTMWAGLGKNSCLCYSSVSLGLSGGTGELPSNMAHCMAGQSVLAVDVGFSQRTPFLTQTSLWGCLPLLPQRMTTRNEHFNWQEVDTASSLKPGPRSCHNMISVIFCCSHSDKVCSDTNAGDVGLIAMWWEECHL